jgi:hypothetical protein
VLAGLAFAAGAAAAAAPQPSFTSEQLVGTLSDDFWEPTTAADLHSGYVYQAVTAIGLRLSNLGSGAPYKTSAGYTFPFGDYGGLAVDSAGTNFAIWGEGDGIYTGGGTGGSWWVRGR